MSMVYNISWRNDLVLGWFHKHNICWDIWYALECKVGDSCELIVHCDMVVSLGKGWFQIDKYDFLDLWNMCLKCVNSARNMLGISMTR